MPQMSSTFEYIKRALAAGAATLKRSIETPSDAKQPSLEVPTSSASNDNGNSLTTKPKRKSRWGRLPPSSSSLPLSSDSVELSVASSIVDVSSSSEASPSPTSGNEGHESEHTTSQSSSSLSLSSESNEAIETTSTTLRKRSRRGPPLRNEFDYLQKCEYMLNEESENDSCYVDISLCNPLIQLLSENSGDFSRMLNCKRVCQCSSDDEELLSFGDEALQVTNSSDFELDEFGRARRDLSFLIDHSKVSSRLELVMMKKKELRKENRQVVPPHVLRDRLMDEFEREQAESERRRAIILAARTSHAAKIYQKEVSKKSKPYIESSQVILDYFNDNGFNEKEARSLALEVIFNHHWEQRYPVRRLRPPCPNGACVCCVCKIFEMQNLILTITLPFVTPSSQTLNRRRKIHFSGTAGWKRSGHRIGSYQDPVSVYMMLPS